jgi:hypothetical protein
MGFNMLYMNFSFAGGTQEGSVFGIEIINIVLF